MLPLKSGMLVPDFDAVRHDPGFLESARKAAGEGGLIILSQARTAAATTILHDEIPKSFVCDTSILSPARMDRLANGCENPCTNPRFGLIASNGFGLGHVTRLQAIGEGLKNFGPVAFMSFSAAMVDGSFYLPSPQYLKLPDESARSYAREAVSRFFNQFDPTHIVYDGNVLPSGLLAALASRPDIHLTWIRRGQWPIDVAEKFMAQQALCDLVIEPGDISHAYDMGPSWSRRMDYALPGAFLKTKPIKPVNPPIFTKQQALAAMGLSANLKHILIMPGASQDAEDLKIIRQCISAVYASDAIPVLAHWPMSQAQPPRIEGAVVVECMPIAQYYAAFDAIITAAGYNSFHEVIESGIPAIFIPQEDPGRDVQLARAQYAEDLGTARLSRRHELNLLPRIREALKPVPPTSIDWHSDWQGLVQAMNVQGGVSSSVVRLDEFCGRKRLLTAMHKRWRKRNKPYQAQFVLALGTPTEKFLKKKIDRQSIIVTNSVDPVALRRGGYHYLWLNGLEGYPLRRQFLNWLSVWRPARITSI